MNNLNFVKNRKRDVIQSTDAMPHIKKNFSNIQEIQCLLFDDSRLFLISSKRFLFYTPANLDIPPMIVTFFEDMNSVTTLVIINKTFLLI